MTEWKTKAERTKLSHVLCANETEKQKCMLTGVGGKSGGTKLVGKRFQKYNLQAKKEPSSRRKLTSNCPEISCPRATCTRLENKRMKSVKIYQKGWNSCFAFDWKGKAKTSIKRRRKEAYERKVEEFMLEWINSKRAEGLCVQSNLIMEKAESTYLDFNEDRDYDFKASRSCLTQVLWNVRICFWQ